MVSLRYSRIMMAGPRNEHRWRSTQRSTSAWSRNDQTTEDQRLALAKVAEHRGWLIVQTYEELMGGTDIGAAKRLTSNILVNILPIIGMTFLVLGLCKA